MLDHDSLALGLFSGWSDERVIDLLAVLRWGPTSWRCPSPECGSLKAYRLEGRPRSRECAGCGLQRSVTAGTLLHKTKLPLGKALDALLPTVGPDTLRVTGMKQFLGCARSTAWLQLMRRLLLVNGDQPLIQHPGPVHLQDLRFLVTRGKLPASAPARVREVWLASPRGSHVTLAVAIAAVGRQLRVLRLAPPPMSVPDRKVASVERPPCLGLRYWLGYAFGRGSGISLRWGPRWVGGLVALWNSREARVDPDDPIPPLGDEPAEHWLTLALRSPPRPLTRLDPWADARWAG
jgi:hypothetical protein